MSYATGRSNFATDEPDGAFWTYTRDDGSRHVCATNAAGVLRGIAATLGVDAQAWTPALLTALRGQAVALADADPAWSDVAARLVAQGEQVTRLDLLFAIYLAFYRPNGLRFDAIALPPEVVAPVLGQTVSGTEQPGACFVPGRDLDPALSARDRAAAVEASTYGVRLRPGEAPPSYATQGITGYRGPTNAAVLVGLGLAAVAAVWLWTGSREYKRGRARR